ncbi:SseB family protein [Micromonospora sp. HM134]|nr:SseB family protein [Micromonospora sp. HM134]
MPIVIEGVILESRDLPVAPAPAPSVAQGPLFVPPAAPAPPVVPPPAAAPFVPPAAAVPPSASATTATPVPPVGGPGAEDTVNLNGTGGPFGVPGRPPASGPVFPPSPTGPPPAARPRPAPDDLWTPSAERAASKARAEVAAAPPDVAPPPVVPAPPAGAPTVPPPAPAADAPVTGPAAGTQAWTAPDDTAPADSAPTGPVAPTPTGDAAGPPTEGAPARTAGAAPTATAPGADGVDPRSTPVDLWTPAAERAVQTSPAAPTTAVPTATAGPTTTVPTTAVPIIAGPTSPAAPGPAAGPAPAGSTPPGSPSTTVGTDTPPTVDEAFLPANEVEENLLDAAGAGSTDGFLSTLLLARVLLPVNPDSVAGSRPGEPGFQWRTGTTDGETYVVVYTSPERLAEHDVPPVETIEVRFVQLIRRWPDPGWAFAVNPGTPVGAKLPGEQIVALASWAAEVGLGDEADLEPVAAAEAPAERTRYAPPVTDPSRPVVMQKAVAPSQLAYYLERGYDRVSGFVHRAGELAHLTTPAELHDALGLGYPDSPFARDAEATYVLRWPAYRPSLYRIPYGGQNEAAMRAMEGWVIERAPFRGNGFAPGESSDVVAEFKVDSARLPHGAQLWRIGTEGTERVIAILDTDALVWRRVGEP